MNLTRGFMVTQRRHFLVREVEGDYQLKEIPAEIGASIDTYGARTGECRKYYSVESIHWTFYFINSQISRKRADEVAEQLTHEFMQGMR
jgi:hypothetical protein